MKDSEKEEQILKFWEEKKIYEKLKEMRKEGKKFFFLDGPPYATGSIHVGTAFNKVIKDCFLRFFRMQGFNVWDQPGYDCHGVPIENKVEKKLGFKSKKDIEKFGVENFIKECRNFATEFIDVMSEQFKNLGVWMDWKNPYLTLTNEYMEGAWFTFKKAFEKGLLYKGSYPVHVCPRCVTKDSLVFTNYDWKSMGELKNCWENEKVMSLNFKNFDLKESQINSYLEVRDKVFKVTTQSGLNVEATLDHPFLTKDGWKELRYLRVGDEIAVVHFPVFVEDYNSNQVILTKNEIVEIIKKLNKTYGNSKKENKIIDRVLRELEYKELLPLLEKNEKSRILFRILGYLFGDGSLIIRKKKKRKFPEIIVFFSAKEKEDLKKIKRDLKKLGFRSSKIKNREKISKINEKEVKGLGSEMYCYSSSLGILLMALGMPPGKKCEVDFDIPKILKKKKLKTLKKEFLRGYFGAELSKPSLRETGKYFKELIFRVEKNRNLESSGTSFVNSIYRLLKELGITVRPLKRTYKKINKKQKVIITGRISCTISNIVRFLESIGYSYCKEREILSSYVLSYLKTKLRNKLSRKSLPKFEIYVKNNGIKNGFIWEKIDKIEFSGIKEVADLNVKETHNFIVNGFVTHNCETVVAYNEIEYTKIKDPAIYVKFRTKEDPNTFLVCFTTTPWTLPANTGIMANPKGEYVRVKVNGEILILAKQLLENVLRKVGIEKYEILDVKSGKEIENLRYEHPFADEFKFQQNLKNAHRVVLSEQFVSLEEGTGLVHTAPGHGEEDYKVGLETGLPIISPVKIDGTFEENCGKYAGMFVKDADKLIIQELREKGLLLHEETILHDYPVCWRCDSPLIIISIPQWFFKVTAIREKLLKENEKIKWVPDWAKQRFRNWLENLGDWPISRQRYWGIPLPIWVCENCGNIKVIGSRKELPFVPEDLHKPYVDGILLDCEKCRNKMRRVPDVLDVWFDSGVAPWASLGYPEKKEPFEKMFPVDFILEGPDQIRGWWNSLMITSMMTFGKASFKSVLFHGFVLDVHGQKMSKSIGNIVTAEEVIEKYGRDVLRLYYLLSPPWEDYYFKWQDVEEIAKSFIIIKNAFNFVKSYVKSYEKVRKLEEEDKWIISRLNSLIENCEKHFWNYHSFKAAQEIVDFIVNDFSRWYIKLVRDRVWPEYKGKDKKAALFTLVTVTENLAKLLAPFIPFFAEEVYQEIVKPLKGGEESVHFCLWPKANKKLIDKKLEEEMEVAKEIFEACSAARQKAKIKLRWPVSEVLVFSKEEKVLSALKRLEKVLSFICNSKSVRMVEEEPKGYSEASFDFGKVFVNPKLDEKLMEEALFKELTRKIQEMRKKYGFKVEERILLTLYSDEKTNEIIKSYSKKLKKEVGASKISFGKLKGEFQDTLKFEEKEVKIAFSRLPLK